MGKKSIMERSTLKDIQMLLYWTFAYIICGVYSGCVVISKGDSNLTADCRNQNLSSIPQDLPPNITDLLFGGNKLVTVHNETLSLYSCLKYLDLHGNDIENLSMHSFSGNLKLSYLDISFNKLDFSNRSLPESVFKGLENVVTVRISSQQVPRYFSSGEQAVSHLKSLKKLVMSAVAKNGSFYFGSCYENLTNLEELTIFGTWCDVGFLEGDSFYGLRFSPLRNLTIRHCKIRGMSALVFQYFPNLESLNVACNPDLGMDNLLSALQTSYGIRLRILIADYVQASFYPLEEDTFCKPSLSELKYLSVRHNSIFKADVRVFKCMLKLEYIAFGSNPIMKGTPHHWRIITCKLLNHMSLTVIDASYFVDSSVAFYEMYQDPPELDTEHYIRRPPEYLWSQVYNNETIPFRINNTCDNEDDFSHNIPTTWKVLFGDHILESSKYSVSNIKINEDNHLLYLTVSHTGAEYMKPPITGFHRLQIFNASNTKLKVIQAHALDDFPSLQRLYLSHNLLGRQPGQFRNVFTQLLSLEILDLSHNRIQSLHSDVFAGLSNLSFLNLSNNFLLNTSFWVNSSYRLKSLDISYNKLPYLSHEFMKQLDGIGSELMVLLNGNPWECSCESILFLQWIRKTNVTLPNKHKFNCTLNDASVIPLFSLDLKRLEILCEAPNLHQLLIISTPIAMCVLIVLVTMLVYHYRWNLRWRYYLFKRYIRLHDDQRENHVGDVFHYHAFIAHHHDDDMQWVLRELLPHAEEEWDLRLCIGYRDFMPGIPIVDNIVDAIDNSHRTVLIVTPSFVQSEWCDFETNMALTKGRGHVVICLMKHVPFEDMSATLRTLVKLNNYIEWSDDNAGRQLFWERLRMALTVNDRPELQ